MKSWACHLKNELKLFIHPNKSKVDNVAHNIESEVFRVNILTDAELEALKRGGNISESKWIILLKECVTLSAQSPDLC